MSLFSRILGRPHDPLVGTWRQIDRSADEQVTMTFLTSGRLEYRIAIGDKLQIIKLTYRVEGGTIVTDQPSSPREERSAFRFDSSNLVLSFEGTESRFERVAS